MSTSFPFLKIARDFDLPYRDVIQHVEWSDTFRGKPIFQPFSAIDLAIARAVEAEQDRRDAVIADQEAARS